MSQTDSPAARPGLWRRATTSRLGALVISWDFLVGVPLGIAFALPAALSGTVSESMSSVLIGMCGIAAGLASLVITAMTVLIGMVGRPYRELLGRVRGGVIGILRPYTLVVYLAVAASLTSLGAGLAWPLVEGLNWRLVWVVGAVPLSFLIWSLLGCVQVVTQVVQHFSNNQTAEDLAAGSPRMQNRNSATG